MYDVKKFRILLPEITFDFCYFKTQFGDYVLYQPSTQSMYAVEDDFINYVEENNTIDLSVAAPTNMEEKIAKYFNEICDDVKKRMNESFEDSKKPDNYFRQVVINVSHDCNLRCKYCYASQGSYGRDIALLSKHVASQILEFFKGKNLSSILFFGGEPLLNTDMITYLAEGFIAQQKTTPNFSVITNGTIVNDHIINILKKYDMQITVSIDGPKNIHDKMRPFEDGCGSYDLVKSNISKLRKHIKDTNISIETVYTKHHLQAGYNMKQLRKYIINDLDLNGKNMVLCHSCMGEDMSMSFELKEELKNVNELFNSFYEDILLEKSPVMDWEWVDSLFRLGKKQVYDALCPLGEGVICITPDGDIYPCHNLAMINELKIGNVFNNNLDETIQKAKEKVSIAYKENSPQCQECWFVDECKGCPAKIYLVEKNINKIPDWFCKTRIDFFKQKAGWIVKLVKENNFELFKENLSKVGQPL
ncbi:radical SAM protein [Clostridium sp. 'deep sea']|uniref:radical SAM/SPASM domain-containing protein n=1 Tax=Clostridium sp. 'deep sea' TaxID=2779445 RepID=UPI00189680E7|nr:radical SAM protein [Clostridium sp. 'deep sea']QOR36415.1 radical SAM protein [Clostridium sp. 'deep sea']